MSTGYEKRLAEHIGAHLKEPLSAITSSMALQVFQKGKKLADLRFGDEYRYYDLASLTKILFTVTAVMRWSDRHSDFVNSYVHDHLPWWPYRSMRVKALLTHSAGLTWWAPFYKKLNLKLPRPKRWEQLQNEILALPRQASGKAVYSDVDFLVLGFIIQELFGKKLENIWQDIQQTLKLPETNFSVNNQPLYKRALYAPTENCPWRKKVLQGEVSDDNSWALGGVAPHAGLFAPIDDVSRWGLLLRQSYLQGHGQKLCLPFTMRRFARRALPAGKGDWALGFMKPTPGKASCGKHFNLSSIGHTGFTGTSFWFDPRKDLMVVILSNRVHPERTNQKFVKLRPRLHDWICELLPES